uniref:Uncharacterized protein n=1 Tax=Strigamia maritima TaxID=126957 RepID=T1JI41_STRMM
MGGGGQTWMRSGLAHLPGNVCWRFQVDGPQWSAIAKQTPCDVHKEEEESHSYLKENCPSGYGWLGSPSQPPFIENESIEAKKPSVCWRFNYGEATFRHKAMSVPSNFHFKEEEIHEYRRKEGDYNSRCEATPVPGPILPTPDCAFIDNCDSCKPPMRPQMPCIPCLPPLPPSCCVPYSNALGEREWHTTDRAKCCCDGSRGTDNEVLQYERNIKTTDPCQLPQVCKKRMMLLPDTTIVPNDMDKFTPDEPPCAEDLPPLFNYAEDKGECNKRETKGPGPYCGDGYVPTAPLMNTNCVPSGYHFNEQRTSCRKKINCAPGCAPPCPTPPSPPCPPKTCPTNVPCPPPQSFASIPPACPPACRDNPPMPTCRPVCPPCSPPCCPPPCSPPRFLGPKPPSSPHPTPPPVPCTGCPGRPSAGFSPPPFKNEHSRQLAGGCPLPPFKAEFTRKKTEC